MGRTTISLDDDVHEEAKERTDNLSQFISTFLRDVFLVEGVSHDEALRKARLRALYQERYLLEREDDRLTNEIERLERRLDTPDAETPAEDE